MNAGSPSNRDALSDARKREQRWNFALIGSELGVWDHNLVTNEKFYSDTWKTIRGIDPEEEVDGELESWLSFVHPDDRSFIQMAVERQNLGDPNYQVFEYREKHRKGNWIWIECRGAAAEWDDNGKPTRIIGTDTDVTERKAAEEMLVQISRRLDLALKISRIGVFESDVAKNQSEWDESLLAIYGLQGTGRLKSNLIWSERLHPEDRERVFRTLKENADSRKEFSQQFRIIRLDGAERIIQSRSVFFTDSNGTYRQIGANWDITEDVELRNDLERAKNLAEARNEELEEARKNIEHIALHDYLTELPNRRYLDQMIEERAALCRDNGSSLAVLHIDLDRFKHINDTLGHRAGDAMLQHAAKILRLSVRTSDFVARIGGDEFLILCSDAPGMKQVSQLAERIIQELSHPVKYEDYNCRIGASIGIALGHGKAIDAKQLLLGADVALYRAKNAGRNRYEFFSSDVHLNILKAKQLSDDILLALERDEFVPFYQLQFDTQNRNVIGAEALARWEHPKEGLLKPEHFLSTAQDLGVVAKIDKRILEKVLIDQRYWAENGIQLSKVSVNVSEDRMADANLIKSLKALKIKPGTITFELLKSIPVDDQSESIGANLKNLRKLGIDVEIDDFGNGHASIFSLLKMKPRALKIDKKLIADLQSSDQRKLLKSIVEIGHSLSIQSIAEGVDTWEQARFLTEIGCDGLQGNIFAHPMPASYIPQFIHSESWRASQKDMRA